MLITYYLFQTFPKKKSLNPNITFVPINVVGMHTKQVLVNGIKKLQYSYRYNEVTIIKRTFKVIVRRSVL